MTTDVDEMIAKVVESLDRVCPAYLAATSDETMHRLHVGKRCEVYERSQLGRTDASR